MKNENRSFFACVLFAFGFILLFTFLTSCVTEKQRLKICNSCPVKKERYDSIVEKILEVPVYLPGKPGPTVYMENPCKLLCDSLGNLKKGVNIIAEKNGQTLHINSQGNGLNITSATKDTTVKAPVKQKEVYNKSHDESVKYIPCDNERTAFDGFTRWFFYIIAPILALWLAWKVYFKRFFPP